ncbi:MAG TPA: hypothetical protein ENH20_01100 [Candidatus Pacearchaeota archaeon]|nr:hypothetical protein [Candidatus Pacearchaeota archaeon]
MIPKVNIIQGKVKDYIGVLEIVILSDNMFKERSLARYPKLKEILKKSKNKKEDLILFFENFEKENKDKLIGSSEKIKKAWAPLNDRIMNILEEIHEIKWTKKHSNFTARFTLSPVQPRYLDYNTFDIFYKDSKKEIIDTFLHELSHFIFFEKLKEVYPKINSKEFEQPHLIWKMSEIMPGIILQDKKIQNIFKNKKLSVHDNIKKIRIGKKLILDILQDFYNKRKDFKDFIKKSYSFIKEYQEEIDKQF